MSYVNIIKMTGKVGYFIIIVAFLQSCISSSPSEPTDEINGSYLYKYPKGQIEILFIENSPRTYRQIFYATENDFTNNMTPLYENKNTWIAIGNELEFHDWLSICYLGRYPDSILTKPEKAEMQNIYWHKAMKKTRATIDVAYEEGYVLRKTDSPVKTIQ